MKQTKLLAILLVGVILVIPSVAVGQPGQNGKPFEEIWNEITSIWDGQVNLQEQIDSIIENVEFALDEIDDIWIALTEIEQSDSPWQKSGSDIYYNAGNVGIGTAEPWSPLHVVGGIYSEGVTGVHCNADAVGVASLSKGFGVIGWSTGGGLCAGVWAVCEGGPALYADSRGGTAVRAETRGDGDAVYATCFGGSGYAGYFEGKVHITGNLSKGSGSFKIDHPLDPENKFLQHSFVESPDMMNVYNGNVTLDENGSACVQLPEYFEALNRDFRYQLTPIGAPGPNLYVAEKITANGFKIAGGQPGMEVSWQVTGVRQDRYAVANRIDVEEDKAPQERGYYLHPTAYGLSEERGIGRTHALKHSLTEEVAKNVLSHESHVKNN